MSRSLKQKVEAEIRRREQEETKKKDEFTKNLIWAPFVKELEKCLESLSDFQKFEVDTEYVRDVSALKNKSQELGFLMHEREQQEVYRHFAHLFLVMTVPNFESGKGQKRTQAQLEIYRFKKRLKKARDERKKELLETCKKVKANLEEEAYTGRSADDGNIIIEVKVKNTTKNIFEKEIVSKYFLKYGLVIQSSDNTIWRFETTL